MRYKQQKIYISYVFAYIYFNRNENAATDKRYGWETTNDKRETRNEWTGWNKTCTQCTYTQWTTNDKTNCRNGEWYLISIKCHRKTKTQSYYYYYWRAKKQKWDFSFNGTVNTECYELNCSIKNAYYTHIHTLHTCDRSHTFGMMLFVTMRNCRPVKNVSQSIQYCALYVAHGRLIRTRIWSYRTFIVSIAVATNGYTGILNSLRSCWRYVHMIYSYMKMLLIYCIWILLFECVCVCAHTLCMQQQQQLQQKYIESVEAAKTESCSHTGLCIQTIRIFFFLFGFV